MRKTEKLSERQRNIVSFMERYIMMNGYPPTIREIGEATAINSTSVVNYNLNKLVQLGYLERSATKSRGLRLVKNLHGKPINAAVRTAPSVALPMAGQIMAGQPVPIPEDNTPDEHDLVEVTPMMLNGADPDEVFALRVKGDSMVDAMVREGDVVILRKTNTARNGDMVAVWLAERGETTLKYFYKEDGDRVRLQPAHPTMAPIYVSAKQCVIQGRVLSVLRVVTK